MKLRSTLAALAALAIVPTILFAQSGDSDISRSSEGRILHRRSPEPGDAPIADTTVYVYAPGDSERNVPLDLVRDGEALPRPSTSTAAAPNERIHTPLGLERPSSDPATPPPAAKDPSAPTAPTAPLTPAPQSADADTQSDANPAPTTSATPPPSANGSDDAPPDAAPPADPGPSDAPKVPDPRDGLGDEARPDRQTEREGTLHYIEVFDPSVLPFKRNRALDVVGEDLVLRASPGHLERLDPVGNRVERGREVFWGSILLSGAANERIAIPSVSPEGNILSYQANPAQDVRFERDAAGNFYATPSLDGRLRLVFVTDAPTHWFGRSLPVAARFDQVPRSLRPKVPRSVQREALVVAAAIGVTEGMSYSATLERLVTWFREFEPGEPPPTQGSVYRDIALGKKGICRHRGHGFVITAQSLGIPAHYVFNEAHVFVEVYIPGVDAGWLRIDLGGGADELQVHGAEGKSMHHPLVSDPFEKPAAFAAAEAAGATRVDGLPEERSKEASGARPSDDSLVPMLGPIVRAHPEPNLEATRTTIALGESLVFRGDAVRITGQVMSVRGTPIATGTVQLLLTLGVEREAVALLGSASVRAGRFSADVAIPPRQAPGNYEIIAEFVSDGVYASSIGE